MAQTSDNIHSDVAVPRPAATILLLREAGDQIEVLLVRRHANMAFMGGQWVFPGGALNRADTSDDALALIARRGDFTCNAMQDLHGQPLPQRQCLGLAIAACRETFEETGLLLATDSHGAHCEPEALARLQAQRAVVLKQPAMFTELLAQQGLQHDLARLIYWAHWITPSSIPRRFDTRFFVIAAPPAQTVSADSHETVEFTWETPATLIAMAQRDEMPVSHPTLYNLHDLQAAIERHNTLENLLAGEASRPVPPILPKMLRENSDTTIVMSPIIVMPWSSDYANSPGDGTAPDVEYPQALLNLPAKVSAR